MSCARAATSLRTRTLGNGERVLNRVEQGLPVEFFAMARDEKSIPTGRVRRTARVGGLVGGQAARAAATKAANVARSPDKRREAAERRYLQAAEQIVDVLGNMKGAAMKVGQGASFLDVSGVPPEYRDLIQQKLAELRDSAPQVPFEQMRKVIEEDLDEPLDEAFAEFEKDDVAA